MRILLINPPVEDFFYTPVRSYPLNLLYLGTILVNNGFEIRIINVPFESSRKILSLPKEFQYLKTYYKLNISPFRLFHNYYRFGSYDYIVNVFNQFRPQIVGISANFTAYFKEALTVAELIKHINKNVIIVIGGRAATSLSKMFLDNETVDFVIRGEAEEVFLFLCDEIKRKGYLTEYIDGLCTKKRNKIVISPRSVFIPCLDTLPIVNRRLINYRLYRFRGHIFTSIIATRGCNFRCYFCGIKEPFRYRKIESIISEMEECYALGIRYFNFEDDNLNLHPQIEELIDEIIYRFGGRIKLSFMNGLLTAKLKSPVVDKLIKAGLTHIDFSVVSTCRNILVRVNREDEVDGIKKVSQIFSQHNIPVTVHFIVGLAGQKFEDIMKDLRFLAELPVLLGPSIFYFLSESEVFKRYSPPFPFNYKFFRSSVAYYDREISRERIFFVVYLSRIINFVKIITDKFSLEGNLYSFLLDNTIRYSLKSKRMFVPERIDRDKLGIILLKKLVDEGKIYRVFCKSLREKKGLVYYFEEEKFIPYGVLLDFIKEIEITSLDNRRVYLKK